MFSFFAVIELSLFERYFRIAWTNKEGKHKTSNVDNKQGCNLAVSETIFKSTSGNHVEEGKHKKYHNTTKLSKDLWELKKFFFQLNYMYHIYRNISEKQKPKLKRNKSNTSNEPFKLPCKVCKGNHPFIPNITFPHTPILSGK